MVNFTTNINKMINHSSRTISPTDTKKNLKIIGSPTATETKMNDNKPAPFHLIGQFLKIFFSETAMPK
jgi:hypothetical protein